MQFLHCFSSKTKVKYYCQTKHLWRGQGSAESEKKFFIVYYKVIATIFLFNFLAYCVKFEFQITNSQNVHHLFQGLYLTNLFIFSIRKFVYFWIIFFLFDMQIKTAPAPLIRSIHTIVKNIQTWTTKEASSILVKNYIFRRNSMIFFWDRLKGDQSFTSLKGNFSQSNHKKSFFMPMAIIFSYALTLQSLNGEPLPSRKYSIKLAKPPLFMSWQWFAFNEVNSWTLLHVFTTTTIVLSTQFSFKKCIVMLRCKEASDLEKKR